MTSRIDNMVGGMGSRMAEMVQTVFNPVPKQCPTMYSFAYWNTVMLCVQLVVCVPCTRHMRMEASVTRKVVG